MGNSTIRLQDVMDEIATIGDLNTVFDNTGGWANKPAVSIGNDVMSELISVRFPWKWNRFKCNPFPTTSLQQDYASSTTDLGWLENGVRVDINSTQVPPATWPVVVVRDLQMDYLQAGFPDQVCWFPNDQLEQAAWPGPNVTYTWPIGRTTTPENPITNILDQYGNILALVTFGITGLTPPKATYPPTDPNDPNSPPDFEASVIGQKIVDGTCTWEVMDPKAMGFRIYPRPPKAGNTWLLRLFAQRKAPIIKTLQTFLDPIPDDQIKFFRTGCIAYAHRYSSNPNVKARFEQMKADWIADVAAQARQNEREDENKGFYPDKNIMSPSTVSDPGPYPYRYGWRI